METRAGSPCIAIRADASTGIGTGHVMRCLTLAEELCQRGANVHFLCRAHPGHMGEVISARGFALTLLPPPVMSFDADDYATWLGAPAGEDARQTMEALQGMEVAWLIVDHYAIDQHWEQLLRPHTAKILVIDDLANRHHDCDLLLDQNYGRKDTDYRPLVGGNTMALTGPHYALLRPEYREHRPASPKANGVRNKRVLVYFGGADIYNLTGQVLLILTQPEFAHYHLDVVASENHPYRKELEAMAARLSSVTLHGTRPHLADLMAEADFAIGAAGATTWERMCLGLPSLVFALAANQQPACRAMAENSLVYYLGTPETFQGDYFRQKLLEVEELLSKSPSHNEKLMRIVDGLGTKRLAECMVPTAPELLCLRQANAADVDIYFHWVNNPAVRASALNSNPIKWEDHVAWYAKRMHDVNSFLYVLEANGLPVGQVRFDVHDNTAEIDYSLDRIVRGRGLAKYLLRSGQDALKKIISVKQLLAVVKTENVSSIKVFQSLGYSEVCCKNDVRKFCLEQNNGGMMERQYIVAAIGEWNRKNFEWFHTKMPGKWHYVATPKELREILLHINPRYIFFPHWRWIVPEKIFTQYECICFHMTDVPYGRGGSPLQNLIAHGHKETVLTALRMNAELDAGPVYYKVPLSLEGRAEEIYQRASELCWQIIEKIVHEAIEPRPQVGDVVCFQRRVPEQSLLPQSLDMEQLYDFIRMLDAPGYPYAFLDAYGYRLEFTHADLQEGAVVARVRITRQEDSYDGN